ncbi:hypothetical protein AB0J14_28135 [Micromonospora arborensis]|uniref:hypothetical protein n=1 Tax=Micromonospora arborensis TaxID=2116518 RepID=UPI0033FF16C8
MATDLSANSERKPDSDTRPKAAEEPPASASASSKAPATATASGSLGERAVQAKAAVSNAAIAAAGVRPVPAERAPTGYTAHPAALADCQAVLRRLYETLNPASLAVLRMFKTLAIGMVVEKSHPEVGRLVWTASGNWNDPAVVAALDALNVQRANPGGSRSPRGAVGAPGDAEQRMLEDAEGGEFVVKTMAVSRPLCGDCQAAVAAYAQENGQVLVGVVVPPVGSAVHAARATAALLNEIAVLRNRIDLDAGEHQVQWDLMFTPSVTGFVGYWANRLFNRDIPPTHIWINAFGAALAANSAARAGNVLGAFAALVRARRHYLLARKQYMTWKEGVEGAGRDAQIAIWVVAVAAVAAVVAPGAVAAAADALGVGTAAGATAAEAGSEAATEQMAVRIASTIAQADATMAAAEAVATAEEAAAEAELLQEMELWAAGP